MAVIHKVVAPDQTGLIRGRYIGTSLRSIADIVHYCETDRLEGILMALDFRNAFNPRPDGPLNFPPPDGRGGCLNTPVYLIEIYT